MSLYSIDICKTCKNKGFEFKEGLICNLTKAKPEFSGSCKDYIKDEESAREFEALKAKRMGFNKVSGGKRFANYLLDMVFFYILIFIIAFILADMGAVSFLEDELGVRIFGLIILLLYYIILEGLTGKTLGKMITGCVVVDEDGNRISFDKSVSRSFCRIIPFEAFSFLGSSARGWHDTISKTYVISQKDFEEEVRSDPELLDQGL